MLQQIDGPENILHTEHYRIVLEFVPLEDEESNKNDAFLIAKNRHTDHRILGMWRRNINASQRAKIAEYYG